MVNGVRVYRPFGPTVFGYGFFYADEDALPWLAFTAISLKLLDILTEDEVRRQEQAQIEATSAPVGELIYWESDTAAGSVTAVRKGTNASGETCREFHQTISVEGNAEDANGIACIGEDGRWRISG